MLQGERLSVLENLTSLQEQLALIDDHIEDQHGKEIELENSVQEGKERDHTVRITLETTEQEMEKIKALAGAVGAGEENFKNLDDDDDDAVDVM